ncbi:sigma-70 family RNA polymerase sigma factor [Sphingobacterium sp.]|uniref:RNA polymerase sigma factor n=1 Tax=Sphingobacterium sp. TaxID=341027 RepID=UPI0028A235D7|nr:sigma-70 family RNA polymerase sigma factor [Sphingobacterium sp.]
MSQRSDTDEIQLLNELREGKHTAFALIYERHWKSMLSIAWNHTKNEALAEDIVHEVFLKLWDNRENYQITNLEGFLATAIKYIIFNNYRKEKNRLNFVESQYDDKQIQDDEKELDRLFLQQYIRDVVEEMPEKCKIVFKFSREDGLKNSEIAVLLNISQKGVEANLTRAIKILKKQMEKDGLYIFISVSLIDSII